MSGPSVIRRCGERGLLIEAPDNSSVHAMAERSLSVWPELEEIVPGHETLLLVWPSRAPDSGEVEIALADLQRMDLEPTESEIVIPTVYDGPDLESLAGETGLSVEAIVSLHATTVFTAAFTGFAPGFAYLVGLPDSLRVARLDEPRPRVPAGSVALAGEYSAVYPTASPGGWRLIGRAKSVMFDPDRERPALIEPGAKVRFEAVDG
jgi:KipI family sensor histidine kinase inhibitor